MRGVWLRQNNTIFFNENINSIPKKICFAAYTLEEAQNILDNLKLDKDNLDIYSKLKSIKSLKY